MTEIKLTLDDPGMAARQLRHAANHWNDGAPKPNPVGDLLLAVADSIEQQVKPAIEEPKEFGSVVMAGAGGLSDRVHWVRCGGFWFTPGMSRAGFEDLHHPEVLRVGIGEPGVDRDAAYAIGREDFAYDIRKQLTDLRSTIITGPEKRIADAALALVAALLGES